MHYVFFETGNDVFFSHIANVFGRNIVQSIIDLYKGGFFTRPGGMIDHELTVEQIKLHGGALCFLNCGLFPNINCGNDSCGSGHITALASNQINVLEESFAKAVMDFYGSIYPFSPRDRLNLQRIFHTYSIANMQQLEEIQAGNEQKHDKYLRLYIRQTNKLKEKAEGFVYIRAQTSSDYGYFINNTELQNVAACDSLQYI
jgi:hypothetical protein